MVDDPRGRGPYQLDPFDHIVAIHFPHGPKAITKLDFVNNKYKVRGRSQSLEDVIGDEGPGHQPAATQQSYRTSAGLDLLRYDSFGLTIGQKKAFLKNKVAVPTKLDPGALNEFLFLNSTMVIEFDWIDVPKILNLQGAGGGFPSGVDVNYEILSSVNVGAGEFFTVGTAELQQFVAGVPAHDVVDTVPYNKYAGPYYSTGFSDPAAADAAFDAFNGPAGPHGTIGEYFMLDGMVYAHANAFTAIGYPFSEPAAWLWFSGFAADFIFAIDKPADLVFTTHVEEIPDGEPYTMVPNLAVYELGAGSPPIDGRIIGAVADPNGSYAPMIDSGSSAQLPAPYGRVRIAVTMRAEKLIASVNGGDPVSMTHAPLFSTPRVPPEGKSYFEAKTLGGVTSPLYRNYEVYFNLPGIVRCVWLFRKPKPDNQLKTMSVVQPLPARNSPKWDNPPGGDQ